jgi:hypothetical protein
VICTYDTKTIAARHPAQILAMSEKNQIRRHVNEVLRNGADFDAFCQDFFPDVRHRYSTDMDRVVKLNLLLELHDSEQILKALKQYADGTGLPLQSSSIIKYAMAVAGLGSMLFMASLFVHETRLRCLIHEERCDPNRPPESLSLDSPRLPPALISLPVESNPIGATVRNGENALLCAKTPCALKVPAHAPLELRFTYPGRESIYKTRDPSLELQSGGIRVYLMPSKIP